MSAARCRRYSPPKAQNKKGYPSDSPFSIHLPIAPSTILHPKQAAAQTGQPETAGFDLAVFEQDLNEKLAAIEGVGRVELMLSLDQTEEAVYAVNTRQTRNGDAGQSYESDLTVVSDGSYGEKPVTVKSLLPTFRGAVVLCDGADNAQVRLAVTQAVGTVCGIGSDKVTVLKMAAGT